jgi:hypothetical protein
VDTILILAHVPTFAGWHPAGITLPSLEGKTIMFGQIELPVRQLRRIRRESDRKQFRKIRRERIAAKHSFWN